MDDLSSRTRGAIMISVASSPLFNSSKSTGGTLPDKPAPSPQQGAASASDGTGMMKRSVSKRSVLENYDPTIARLCVVV